MHNDDPPKTHGLNLLICELFTDETGNVGVWGREFHLSRLCVDVLEGIVALLEE